MNDTTSTKADLPADITTLVREEDGLVTVEYVVAGAVIATATIAAFTALGQEIATQIGKLMSEIKIR